MKYFLKENKLSEFWVGWFSDEWIFFCSTPLYWLLYMYNDIWYHKNYLKYINTNPAQLFRYLLFYIKPDTVKLLQTFHYRPIHFKVYKAVSYNIFKKEIKKYKKTCCINIDLAVNPLNLNKNCMCNLLYMMYTHYQNKTLYNSIFGAYFTDVFLHTQNTQDPFTVL